MPQRLWTELYGKVSIDNHGKHTITDELSSITIPIPGKCPSLWVVSAWKSTEAIEFTHAVGIALPPDDTRRGITPEQVVKLRPSEEYGAYTFDEITGFVFETDGQYSLDIIVNDTTVYVKTLDVYDVLAHP